MHRILYRSSAPEDVQEHARTQCHGEIMNLDQDIRQLGDLNYQLMQINQVQKDTRGYL